MSYGQADLRCAPPRDFFTLGARRVSGSPSTRRGRIIAPTRRSCEAPRMNVVRIIAESRHFRKDRFSFRMVVALCKDAALVWKARAGSHLRCTHFDIASSFSLMCFHRHGIGFPRLCTPLESRPFAFTWKIGFFSLRAIRNSVMTPGAL